MPKLQDREEKELCRQCGKPQRAHWFEPHSTRGHCAKCGKPMQFADGVCWRCYGGDPGR